MSDFIQSFSGRSITFLDPQPEQIEIGDISHTLALLCRFGGHCKKFYSVAQHSVLCADHVSDEFKFEALMHDATEAYLVDMPRPIKYVLQGYRDIEASLDRVIRLRYHLPLEMSKQVHEVDNRMLATERRDLMNPSDTPWDWLPEPYDEKVTPWEPGEAQRMFEIYFERYRPRIATRAA